MHACIVRSPVRLGNSEWLCFGTRFRNYLINLGNKFRASQIVHRSKSRSLPGWLLASLTRLPSRRRDCLRSPHCVEPPVRVEQSGRGSSGKLMCIFNVIKWTCEPPHVRPRVWSIERTLQSKQALGYLHCQPSSQTDRSSSVKAASSRRSIFCRTSSQSPGAFHPIETLGRPRNISLLSPRSAQFRQPPL
ncbi:hypothetical protein RRG08_047720 [Elysia crispata]|uniref:Uncharacterized protein n=1 Tax=Elysia crispata TaxID=231223 RepID=A0AAE1A939_9GAST|nr:hypothetical protein RRG08_047720 [Elysia crispata]